MFSYCVVFYLVSLKKDVQLVTFNLFSKTPELESLSHDYTHIYIQIFYTKNLYIFNDKVFFFHIFFYVNKHYTSDYTNKYIID
jgi:hypothetical protein